MTNPLAPAVVQGIPSVPPPGFLDMAFSYPFSFSLTANQVSLGNVVSILIEADFYWRGLSFVSDGVFAVRFQDGQQYYLSTGFIYSTNLPNTAGDPFPFFPEVYYPAGGRITVDLQDLSGGTNTGQLLFIGTSRYRVLPAVGQ